MDWGLGCYERIASQLLPAAEVVVGCAAPAPGEHVVDVGCGTGNAALLAAGRGAQVTGIDPSQRLLDVACTNAADQRLEASFAQGDASALPLEDASANVVVSVFGVIFAPDAHAAVAEMARVTAPGGRIVLSAWLPTGALYDVAQIRREALAPAVGSPAAPAPFAWHDEHALAGLLDPHGFSVELHEERLPFTATSPKDFLEHELSDHPMWIAARGALASSRELQAVRARALEVFSAANEQPDAFRVTSRYVVARATRGSPSLEETAP